MNARELSKGLFALMTVLVWSLPLLQLGQAILDEPTAWAWVLLDLPAAMHALYTEMFGSMAFVPLACAWLVIAVPSVLGIGKAVLGIRDEYRDAREFKRWLAKTESASA